MSLKECSHSCDSRKILHFHLHHFRWNILKYLHEANSQLQFFFNTLFLLVQEYLHPILWHKLWCTYMNCNYQLNDKNRPIFMPSKCSQSLNYIKHILLHSQLEIREFWYTLLFSASKETTNYQFSLTTQLNQNTQSNIAERVP